MKLTLALMFLASTALAYAPKPKAPVKPAPVATPAPVVAPTPVTK